MSNYLCKAVICNRCSKSIYLKFIRSESLDYGGSCDIYEELPDNWMYTSQIGDLCPECAREFQVFVLNFFNGDADKIAPGWKCALTLDDLRPYREEET